MAIVGPSSYIPTTELFLSHWQEANILLGALTPLLVGQANPAGGVPLLRTRADLDTLRASLLAARGLVTGEAVNLAVKRGEVRDKMAALLGRFNQFASAVRSRYAGKAYDRALPPAPAVGDAPETFLKSIDKATVLWSTINATLGGAPLTLGQGTVADPVYASIQFSSEASSLQTTASDIHKSEGRLRILLEMRNDLQDVIKPLLRDYRQAISGRFAENHALVQSLPRFSPLPGNKPDAPEITSAQWNAAEARAEVAFTPSTSSDVARHELRLCPGTEYNEDLEVLAATLAAGEPPLFTTTTLFDVPGVVVSAKVYAMTGDDRENGSQAMSIQRPPL